MTAPPEIISLAERWAWWEAKKREAPDHWERISAGPPPLLDHEREALLGWVRLFMQRKHGEYVAARLRFGSGLGLTATRDPVSRDIALALGFTKDPFAPQHGTAVWRLCEAAGWP